MQVLKEEEEEEGATKDHASVVRLSVCYYSERWRNHANNKRQQCCLEKNGMLGKSGQNRNSCLVITFMVRSSRRTRMIFHRRSIFARLPWADRLAVNTS